MGVCNRCKGRGCVIGVRVGVCNRCKGGGV